MPSLSPSARPWRRRSSATQKRFYSTWMLDHLRRDLAQSRSRSAGALTIASDPALALWRPRHATTFTTEGQGRDRAIWTESGGVVAQVANSTSTGTNLLMFRYPLAGTFEFSVDASATSWAQGTFGYGGLFADQAGMYNQSSIHNLGYTETISRASSFSRDQGFNRLTLRVSPGKVSYLIQQPLILRRHQVYPHQPLADPGSPAIPPGRVQESCSHRQAGDPPRGQFDLGR